MFHIFSRCPTFLSYSFWGLLQMKDKSPEHLIHLHSKTSEEFYIKASNRTAETKMLWPIGTARIFAMVTTSCKHILYTLLLDLGVQSWSWRGRSTPFKHDSWSSNSWKHLTCSWSNHNKSVFYGGPVHINHHFPMVFPWFSHGFPIKNEVLFITIFPLVPPHPVDGLAVIVQRERLWDLRRLNRWCFPMAAFILIGNFPACHVCRRVAANTWKYLSVSIHASWKKMWEHIYFIPRKHRMGIGQLRILATGLSG